jgi:NET1-associated nuclear protein 1 (U3 small nucleolar RNA-associated protein 17)
MADSTPQLKRKRETGDAQRKKAKTLQRNGGAGASLDESETIAATPVTATPKGKSAPKNKSDVHSTPKPAQTNKDAPASTPSTARKGKKDQTPGAKNKGKKDKKPEAAAESDALVKVDTAGAVQVVPSSPAKAKKQKSKAPAKWLMSSGQGGWFLPSDPVFSPDEKFMILATVRSLDIYFTETSLLAYKLPVGGSGTLTAYALSATNPTQVYVADSTGLITLWDWVLKQKIGRWDIGATVRNMTVTAQSEPAEDLVYCHEQGVINVHALRTGAQASTTEVKCILKVKSLSPVLGVQVLLQGRFVIAACADSIMVGKRLKPSKTAVQDFEYVWRELKFAKRITTFNAHVREVEAKLRGAHDQRDVIDIATGDESGVVFLFEDILASFAAVESSQKGGKSKADSAESLRPKKFHWHREAVGSVKWSLDGRQHPKFYIGSANSYRQLPHLWRRRDCSHHLATYHWKDAAPAPSYGSYREHRGLTVRIVLRHLPRKQLCYRHLDN